MVAISGQFFICSLFNFQLNMAHKRLIRSAPPCKINSFLVLKIYILNQFTHRRNSGLNDTGHIDPSIAQLVERWTVVDSIEIHRSLVQIRFEGFFFM